MYETKATSVDGSVSYLQRDDSRIREKGNEEVGCFNWTRAKRRNEEREKEKERKRES